jgi:hypothetical protein
MKLITVLGDVALGVSRVVNNRTTGMVLSWEANETRPSGVTCLHARG